MALTKCQALSLSLSVRYIRFNYIRKYRALPLTARINFCFWLEPKCTHNAHIQRHKEVHTKWKHTNHLRRSSRHRKKSYLQNSAWSQIKHSHTSTWAHEKRYSQIHSKKKRWNPVLDLQQPHFVFFFLSPKCKKSRNKTKRVLFFGFFLFDASNKWH